MVEFNGNKYKLEKNYKDAYDEEAFLERVTDYFSDYDYIFGDWAYGKLRLKGFYKAQNEKAKETNNIENLDKHIKEDCAYECRYFLLEKM